MSIEIERALISGASAGIGAEFARQLAVRNVALVLVARRRERLERLAAELDVDVEVLPADLTDPGERAAVERRLAASDAPVDLLVNSAGFGTFGDFHEADPDQQVEMVELNAVALLRLMRAALGQQVPRGRGGVINIGSTAGFQPTPHGATYGATKALVRSLTEAVAEEMRGEPVRVMLLAPGFTDTEFQEVGGVAGTTVPDAMRMSAEKVVATALRDFARGRTVCVPGVLHATGALSADVVPSAVSRRIAGYLYRRFGDFR